MNLLQALLYYFIFLIVTITLFRWLAKKENYSNIVDYNIDLVLHDIRKELSQKIKEKFSDINQFYKNEKIDGSFDVNNIISNPNYPSEEYPENIKLEYPIENSNIINSYEKYHPFDDKKFTV